ncbi:MAG TPA: hypothetical protein VN734_17055 [Acidobacteriaceae bacterium]|nr:hypothetical protein [Acidobacteriaceae bacterium]
MANLNAILGGVAAAAPGAAQGIQALQAKYGTAGQAAADGVKADQAVNQQLGVTAMSPAQLDAGQTGAIQGAGAGTDANAAATMQQHPMAQANHPFWNVLSNLTGGGGAAPAAPAGGAIPAMENGGVVRENYGKPVRAPGFEGDGRGVIPSFTQAPGLQSGGVMRETPTQVGAGRDMTGIGAGVIPASTEGQILTMAGGGAVPDGFVPNSESVQAPMTGGPAGFVSGFAEGQNIGHNIESAILQRRAREANAEGADAAMMDPSQISGQDQSQQAQQPSMLDKARDAVEGFFQHLHEHTLGENGKPNGPAALPTTTQTPDNMAPPDTAAATKAATVAGQQTAQQAAASGAPPAQAQQVAQQAGQKAAGVTAMAVGQQQAQQDAASGGPQPIQPHSQTTDYWEESNQRIAKAVHAAAMAGEDPSQVFQALNAMRTAHYQGQITRYLSGAYTSLMNGDEKGVQTALKNVNYYLPNGQDIAFRKATAADVKAGLAAEPGALMFRNPMASLTGPNGGGPEWQEVTAQHLQLLGQAALNPQTVQQTILSTYSAEAAAQAKLAAARGTELTGEGRYEWGLGMRTKAQADAQLVPVRKYLSFALGKKAEAEANWFNDRAATTRGMMGPKVTFPALQTAQQNAIKAVDSQIQGAEMPQPAMVAGPNGTMMPNPNAGKSLHDPGTVGSLFKGLSNDQRVATERLAATFAGANVGVMNSVEAAELAARVVRMQGARVMPTHIDPATHKPANDIIFDPKQNTVHVWVGNGWQNAYIQPNVSEAAISSDQMPSTSDGATAFALGGGGGSEPGEASPMNGQ